MILFILTFTLNLVLSGLLSALENHLKVAYYRKLALGFLGAGIFMLFWYFSSYIVLNVDHRETVIYTIIEALAFISAALASYFLLSGIFLIPPKTKGSQPVLAMTLIGAGILGFTKCAPLIFITHYPIIYWLKLFTALGIILLVMFFSLRLLIRKQDESYAFPRTFRWFIGLAGALLPLAGMVDYLIVREKFYEGAVQLSMNFPLFITGYFIFSILFIWALVSQNRRFRNSTQGQFTDLAEIYNITPRELEIIKMIVQGKSNQEIARLLFISLSTVKNHIHHIFQKLGVSSRFELIQQILGPRMG